MRVESEVAGNDIHPRVAPKAGHELLQPGRVQFATGIGHGNVAARGGRDTQIAALGDIARFGDRDDIAAAHVLLEDLARAIRARPIDNDDFVGFAQLAQHTVDKRTNGVMLVADSGD